MLVFIIDDNPDDRALVLHQLKAALPEAVAREIGTAEQLEDAFSRERPSLVITDLALGWTSGLDVLRRVKALDSHCPVILFTGAGDEQAAVEVMKAGADDYVVKNPKRLARLRTAIREVVEAAARKAPVRQSNPPSQEAADQDKRLPELYAQVDHELSGVIDLLRDSAAHQVDLKIADHFARAA